MADDLTIRFPALTCHTCGQTIEEGKKFCSSCGTPVDNAPLFLLCQYCGGDLSPQAVFCGACGKKAPQSLQVMPVADSGGIPPLPSSHFPPLALSHPRVSQASTHGPERSQAEVRPNQFVRKLKFALGLIVMLGGGILVGTWLVAPELPSPAPTAAVHNPLPIPPPANTTASTTAAETKPVSPPTGAIAARFPDEPSTPAQNLPATAAAETPPVASPQPAQPAGGGEGRGQVVTPDGLLPIRIYGESKTSPANAERSVEAIRERVEASLGPIREAYTQALAKSSGLLGLLTLELTVGGDGRVEQALTHATAFADTALPIRVQEQAQQWRFPSTASASGSVKIFYPLLFLPQSLDPRAVIALTKELIPGRYKLIAPDPTSVHEEPNEEAPTVGTVSVGLKVYIVSSQGDWLGVLSPKGEVGYIKREAVASALQTAP